MFRLFTSLIVFVSCLSFVPADDWPEFLGPAGAAKTSEVVPTEWSESENLIWKFDLPGSGSSSPIIIGDRVLVTAYVDDGQTPKRQVICIDKNTGQQSWASDFPLEYREDDYRGYITEHGYASNTPVSDGEHIFAFFGKGGVHALDLDGNKLWSADVGKDSSNRQWGSAASLLLYENSVIVNAADEAKAIIALDKVSGKEVWRQEASMLELTFGTPRVVTLTDGKQELVISVPGEIWALNPTTGKLSWYAATKLTGNVSPSIIVDGETVYSFGGFRSSGSIAVRAGGKDEVSDTHTLWTNRSSSYVATPLLHERRFYWIDDRGIAYSTSVEDGKEVYKKRVENLKSGRPVYASPVLIGKHIYVVTRKSGTYVYAPGDDFSPIAQNVIEGDQKLDATESVFLVSMEKRKRQV